MTTKHQAVREFNILRFINLGALPAVGAGTPASNGGNGRFGGFLYTPNNLCFADIRLTRGTAGSSGTTTAELWRRRSGSWTLIATVSVTQAAGDLATSSVSMAGTSADSTTLAGDVFMARVTAVEAGSPADLTLACELR